MVVRGQGARVSVYLSDHAARPVESVLCVQLDDLLVVVGALEQLDARVERPAVGTEADLVRI